MFRRSSMCVKFISLVVLCCLQLTVGVSSNKGRKNDAENIKHEKGDVTYPDDLQLPKQNNYMVHHHHHSPDYFLYHHHHHHPINGGGFHRHGPQVEEELDYDNSSMQIPLKYIQDLNDYNVTDLLLNFVDGDDISDTFIQNRFGEGGEERSAATIPKGAECMPELTTVKIASSDDPSVLYIPQCTRVERCGGCCKHELLSCQPLQKESIPFKVYKTQYTGEKKLKFLGTDVVTVEKHNKCKCLCRVKAEDCTKFQEYRESECRCVCVNHDERKKCAKSNNTKLWNPDLCVCQCRESMQCSTGSYFDHNECRCLTLPRNRRANYDTKRFRSEPLAIVPLDGDYY